MGETLITAFVLLGSAAATWILITGRQRSQELADLRALNLAPRRTIGEARDGEPMTIRGRIVVPEGEEAQLIYRAFEASAASPARTALEEVLVEEFRVADETGELLVRTPGAEFFVAPQAGRSLGVRELLLAEGEEVVICGVAAWEAAAGESYREPSRRLVMSRDNGHSLRITNLRRALR
jgi:hypothetical protein